MFFSVFAVALLAEGVDRNVVVLGDGALFDVALLAEGVDRNTRLTTRVKKVAASPSSRRAWIEMSSWGSFLQQPPGRPPRGGRG